MWVGEDQPATIGKEGYGARYALPIWSEFIKAAAKKRGAREFLPADGMQEVQLCKVSYLKPVEGCPDLYASTSRTGTTSRHACARFTRAP